MAETKIDYVDRTWNVVTGCDKVSPGCDNCYAEKMVKQRHSKNPKSDRYGDDSFNVRIHEGRLNEPLKTKKPQRYLVCSMGDLFHEDVPDDFIRKVFFTMMLATQHTFMVLTKRPERMRKWFESLPKQTVPLPEIDKKFPFPLPNVWLGTSVENQEMADKRIPELLATPAHKRWVSVEPMLGAVNFTEYMFITDTNSNLTDEQREAKGWEYDSAHGGFMGSEGGYDCYDPQCDINFVVCGGESGANARPMHPEWAENLQKQCEEAGVPFYFKQWGAWKPLIRNDYWANSKCDEPAGTIKFGTEFNTAPDLAYAFCSDKAYTMLKVSKKKAGHLLNGKEYRQLPEGF